MGPPRAFVLIPAKVGIVGLNVNLAPYGADMLKEKCQTENRDPNNLAVPPWGIRARTQGKTAVMTWEFPYALVETDEGVGIPHLPILEAFGSPREEKNFPQTNHHNLNLKQEKSDESVLPCRELQEIV